MPPKELTQTSRQVSPVKAPVRPPEPQDLSGKTMNTAAANKATPLAQFDDFVIQLNKLRELKDAGALTQQEYDARRKALIDKQ